MTGAAERVPWEARNPEFDAVVRESFGRQTHMATLGAKITRLEPGAVDLTAPYDARFGQQNGFWHAGAVASLADSYAILDTEWNGS